MFHERVDILQFYIYINNSLPSLFISDIYRFSVERLFSDLWPRI